MRVRFAPSPTGGLHIGGVRTALYNFLLARRHGGKMLLRIEDTDQARYVPGAEAYIVEALRWAGIQIDEGVGVGGPHAPYRQSERREIYARHVQDLVNSGGAYLAFDTEDELNQMRERLKQRGDDNLTYNSISRKEMKNSLTLSGSEVEELISKSTPYVVRLKVQPGEEIILHDLIRGEVRVNSAQIDDKVLLKSDGLPTYHLANVVDDYLMKITHVIRGEEWLPSAPLHVLIYRYFGWADDMPKFAHLPLLLKPDGQGKLSKRDAERMGFPIFPLTWKDPASGNVSVGYKEAGYLPEAMTNFLALLGWNPGTEQELFSMDELISSFSLERINKAGAHFDIHKAQWFNQQYLRKKSDEDLAAMLLASLKEASVACSSEKAVKIASILRERITFPSDLMVQAKIFFENDFPYDADAVSKKWTMAGVQVLKEFAMTLDGTWGFVAASAKAKLEEIAARTNVKTGAVLPALRIAITGGLSGPDLMATLEILGPEETKYRIEKAITSLTAK